ncbi:MAG: tetratricopeptide repeat protein, partial [Planctomycetota bacterium]
MRTDRYILAVILAAALGACADEVAPPDKSVTLAGIPAERLDRIVSQFNKGVGLMDRYRPAEAVKAFEEVVKLAPGWISGHLNLGIALLNSQGEENYARAERVLRAVTAADPENPHAHYALGMLLRHLTRMDEARTHFAQVLEIDPEDPDAHYQLGILLIDEDPQAARDHLEKTLARVPHHESACYRLQTLLRQAGEKQRALELLRRFKALKTAKAGVFSGMKYGEMGRYAEVIRAFELPRTKGMEPPSPPAFVDRAEDSGLTLPGMGSAEWPCQSSRSPGPPA